MAPALEFLRTERISLRCGPSPAPAGLYPDRATYLLRGKALAYPEFETFHCAAVPMLRVSYPVASADYPRLALATIWAMLGELPDLRLVQRLMVLDFTHEEEFWIRQVTGQPGLTIRAQSDTRGHIKLFRPAVAGLTAAAIRHEWCHLLKLASPEEGRAFETLGDLEPLDATALLGDGQGDWTSVGDEVWATLGQRLLDGFLDGRQADAMTLAHAYPIRATLWGRAFRRRRAGSDIDGASSAAYADLTAALRAQTEPTAVARLEAAAARSDIGRAARALGLIGVA